MGYRFVQGDSGQMYLLPPDARDWLPPRHLAWALLEQAGRLDMAPFTAWYRADGQGRPGYHPRLMVALVMYCYCKGVRSSRAIEMATWDDVGAREESACQARAGDYQRRAAAKAATGSRKRPDGRAPALPGEHSAVRRARQAADRAREATVYAAGT